MGIDPLLSLRLWQLVAWIVLYFSVCPLVSSVAYMLVGVETIARGDLGKSVLAVSGVFLTGLLPLVIVLLAVAIGFPSTRRWLGRVRKPLAWIALVLIGLSVTGSLLWSLVYGVGSIASGSSLPEPDELTILMCGASPSLLYLAIALGLAVRTLREERKLRQPSHLAGGKNER